MTRVKVIGLVGTVQNIYDYNIQTVNYLWETLLSVEIGGIKRMGYSTSYFENSLLTILVVSFSVFFSLLRSYALVFNNREGSCG